MDWENLPSWLSHVVVACLTALGMLGAGWFTARSQDKKTGSDDRVAFTSQVLERVTALEGQLAAERSYCEDRMVHLEESYERRLKSRDRIITELRKQEANREARLTHLEELIQGLN